MENLVNDKIINFPDEIDTSGEISYDFTNFFKNDFLKGKIMDFMSSTQYSTIISFSTNKHDIDLVSVLAYLLGKKLIIANTKNGLPNNGIKYNYKEKYIIWINTLQYDEDILLGLNKIISRGLKILSINSLIDNNEGVRFYIETLKPDINISSTYNLYNLMDYLESKNLINGFIKEKCKFIADKYRKKTHHYLENYTATKNKSFSYLKSPIEWYINNYYIFNHPNNKNTAYSLQYVNSIEWKDMRADLEKYGDKINSIVINKNSIVNLDDIELGLLQSKHNFTIIDYCPFNYLLSSRDMNLNNNLLSEYKTNYDAIIYSIDMNLWTEKYEKDLITDFSRYNTKIMLYVNLSNNINHFERLRDLIIYSNDYLSSIIQGVIFDYDIIKNITIPQKMELHKLIPLTLQVNNITENEMKYFERNKFGLMLANIFNYRADNRKFLVENKQINKNEIDKYVIELSKNKKDEFTSLSRKINNFSYKLNTIINKRNDNVDEKISFLHYLSPRNIWNYLLSSTE